MANKTVKSLAIWRFFFLFAVWSYNIIVQWSAHSMQCKTTQCAIIKCAFGCNGIIWHEPRYRQNMNSLNSSFSDRMTERATTSKLLNNFFILTHTSHSQTLCRFTHIHVHISTQALTHTHNFTRILFWFKGKEYVKEGWTSYTF